MPNVLISLSNRSFLQLNPPSKCPYCGNLALQGWGKTKKNLLDNRAQEAEITRYRCPSCGRTFRQYPIGIDRASQSHRIRKMAALIYTLGMSSREVAEILKPMGFGSAT